MNESIIRGDDVTQEPPVPFTLVEIIASIQNIKTDYEKAKVSRVYLDPEQSNDKAGCRRRG
jgi:hypothetical protein